MRALTANMRLALSVAVMLLLSGCQSVGPDYRLPEKSAFAEQQGRATRFDAQGAKSVVVSQAPLPSDWWVLYDDAQLNSLVKQALQANAELKVAAARLQMAQAHYEQAKAAGEWDFGVGVGIERGQISAQTLLLREALPPFNFADIGIAASYQFDFWGKLKRGVEAAQASNEAFEAANDLARIAIAARVVGAYLEICHGNHEIHVAQHSLALQQRSRDIAVRLKQAGRGTPTAVARADSQVGLLQATIPLLRARRQAAGYELADLLGLPPDRIPQTAMQCEEAPVLAQPIPVGDGAVLLRRRPDVRQAERELAAATAEIGVATADLYPNVRLGAGFGYSGLLADIGKDVTRKWNLGPLISWTIPGRGAHARVTLAKAGAGVALAEFDKTVLDALRDVQTILTRYAEDLQRLEALTQVRDHAKTAAENERALYQAGRQAYLFSLDADRVLSGAEASLAEAEAQIAQDQVRLFLALGGGWRKGEVLSAAADAPRAE